MSVSKRVYTPSLVCYVSEKPHASSTYIISVSKKVQKSAVKRNRMKRIIRAAFRQILPTVPSSLHFVIRIHKDCSMKKTSDMRKELELLKSL